MYASAVPISLGWLLLWNPPALSHSAMLAWVFASSIIVRSAVSAYEVPSAALAPELTADYDERTRIIAYRFMFGWIGGLSMPVLAYTVFLVASPGQANGLLNRGGYRAYALTGAVVMFLAILISAWGTHREIARLPRAPRETLSVKQIAAEMIETMRNKGFVILMAAGFCSYVAQGVSFALSNYLYSFVWQLQGSQLTVLPAVLLAGVLIAFAVGPRTAGRVGKRRAAAGFAVLATILLVLPYALRLSRLFPRVGSPAMVPVLFAFIIVNIACSVSAMMVGSSMMADVVEQSEVATGRRSEGVFFAGGFFIQKCNSGVGIFLAGVILSIASFPPDARVGAVGPAAIDRLTIIFCLFYLALGLAAAWFNGRFPFGREEHDGHVRALGAVADGQMHVASDATRQVPPLELIPQG